MVLAANPEDFRVRDLDAIWKEIWKPAGPKIKEPRIEKLSERQVIERMAGNWTVTFGVASDKLVISMASNRLIPISSKG